MALSHRLLVHFATEHLNFRFAELQALLEQVGVKSERLDTNPLTSSFAIFNTDSVENFCLAASRSVLVKSVHEFWAEGTTITGLVEQLVALPSEFASAPFKKPNTTFKITVKAINKRISSDYQLRRIEFMTENSLEWMKTTKVRLKNPGVELMLFEEYTPVSFPYEDFPLVAREPAAPSTADKDNNDEATPLRIYFGRLLCEGMRTSLNQFSLSDRYFIGSTSLDPCLAALMVNLAQVAKDSVVYDPFCGTGSILVAAAHRGGYVCGSDIDAALLFARCKNTRAHTKLRRRDESVRQNLVQYKLVDRYLDVLVADAAANSRLWRYQASSASENRSHARLFDAIVTDPPYGIRESASRSYVDDEGDADGDKLEKKNSKLFQYALDSLMCDLVDFGAANLQIGGRLVFWIPVHKPTYTDACVPSHPAFRLVANCEHPLFKNVGRRLLVLEKKADCGPEERASIADRDYYRSFRDSYFQNETNLAD